METHSWREKNVNVFDLVNRVYNKRVCTKRRRYCCLMKYLRDAHYPMGRMEGKYIQRSECLLS